MLLLLIRALRGARGSMALALVFFFIVAVARAPFIFRCGTLVDVIAAAGGAITKDSAAIAVLLRMLMMEMIEWDARVQRLQAVVVLLLLAVGSITVVVIVILHRLFANEIRGGRG